MAWQKNPETQEKGGAAGLTPPWGNGMEWQQQVPPRGGPSVGVELGVNRY